MYDICLLFIFYYLQVLNLCLEELLFDRSVLQEEFTKAHHCLNKITELDHYSAQYRYVYVQYWQNIHLPCIDFIF